MKAVTVEESRYVRGAEDISFLHLLHQVPEQPSVNTTVDSGQGNDAYILSAARELRLASSIAFLSSITDNPDHISAVCVQEKRDKDRIDILLAINKRGLEDGESVLTEICGVLSGIFERLSRPTEGNCEMDCFTQIIGLCKSRILYRLGYEPGKHKASRKTIEELLTQAKKSLVDLGKGVQVAKMGPYRSKSASMTQDIAAFLTKSTNTLQLVSEWSQHKEDARLCALIDGLWSLAAVEKLEDVVELIPNVMMEPSLRQSLVNMILKCSRYRDVARILYRTAKKTPIARRMTAVTVQLPESAFQKTQTQSTTSCLQDVSHRILEHQRHRGTKPLERICQVIKRPVPDAAALFHTQAQRSLHKGKFHAEVQLVYHVLANPSIAPPRFVCSSKDACYLCNLLIQAYGKMQTPRCHGRLYPGWRLPRTAEFMALQSTMNTALEVRIRESVNTLLDRPANRWIQNRDPCESSYFAVTRSNTTIAQREDEAPIIPAIIEVNMNGGTTDASASNSEMTSASSTILQRSTQNSPMELSSPSTAHPPPSIRQSYAIAQGEVVSSSVEHGRASELYTSDMLEVQLEYTARALSAEKNAPRLGYQIQRLTAQEAQSVQEDGRIPIIDVNLLPGGKDQDYKLHNGTDLYLAAEACIFRLTLNPTSHNYE